MADDTEICPNPRVDPYIRELNERDERVPVLTPWTVQNICYEALKNYMLVNSPQEEGYMFSQRYDEDPLKSGIGLEIAYSYKDAIIQKRPGVYISRGESSFKYPIWNQMLAQNPAESTKTKSAIIELPIIIAVVATNVGFVEQLAEYVFKFFLRHLETLTNDFNFRRIQVANVSPPQLYLESKDHFVINITLLTHFDMNWYLIGDDLKLKTFMLSTSTEGDVCK